MTRGDLVVMVACGVAGFWAVNAWLGMRGDAGQAGPANDRHDDDALRDPDAPATLANWYRILEVREDADRDTIAQAWRRKVGEYHPDKVARLGPEIRSLAERRTQQVNAAYEIGMRLFR